MNCREALRLLPGYLDGAISSRHHARLRQHLSICQNCAAELDGYNRMAAHLAQVSAVEPPADLALRIRVQASQPQSPWAAVRLQWKRAAVIFENVLEPLAVPATGGILTALVVFALVVSNILVGVPLGGVVSNDLPLNIIQPARLESLAPFPVTAIAQPGGNSDGGILLIEATLNAQGQVVSYRILSGGTSPAIERQLDQVLLFSRFRPQFSFGRPMDGGHVMLSFSEVRVRG